MKVKTLLFILGVLVIVPPSLVLAYGFHSAVGLVTIVFWWALLTWLARRLGIVQPCGHGACSIHTRPTSERTEEHPVSEAK